MRSVLRDVLVVLVIFIAGLSSGCLLSEIIYNSSNACFSNNHIETKVATEMSTRYLDMYYQLREKFDALYYEVRTTIDQSSVDGWEIDHLRDVLNHTADGPDHPKNDNR